MNATRTQPPKATRQPKDDERLARADEEEQFLLSLPIDWPDRADEFIPLVSPTDFFSEQDQKIWRTFRSQLALTGAIDVLTCARKLNCAEYFAGLAGDYRPPACAKSQAVQVKRASRNRQLYELLMKATEALLRGRQADAIIPQLDLALEAFQLDGLEGDE